MRENELGEGIPCYGRQLRDIVKTTAQYESPVTQASPLKTLACQIWPINRLLVVYVSLGALWLTSTKRQTVT